MPEMTPVKESAGQHLFEQYALDIELPFVSFRPQYIYGPKSNKNDYIDWFFDRLVRELPISFSSTSKPQPHQQHEPHQPHGQQLHAATMTSLPSASAKQQDRQPTTQQPHDATMVPFSSTGRAPLMRPMSALSATSKSEPGADQPKFPAPLPPLTLGTGTLQRFVGRDRKPASPIPADESQFFF